MTMSSPRPLDAVTNLGDVLTAPPRIADRTAVIDLIGEIPRRSTYRELDRLAGGVAVHLRERGLQPGDRVGIVSLNRTEYLAGYLGIMRAGMVAVPLSNKLPGHVLDAIVRDAELRLVLVDQERRDQLPGGCAVLDFDDPGPDGFARAVTPAAFPGIDPGPDGVAQMLYTSGSTGMPKGVPLSHRGQLWALRALMTEPLDEHDPETTIIAQPLFHMNGIVVGSAALALGDTIVLQPRFRTDAYVAAIRDHQVSQVSAVPTMWSRAVHEALAGRADLGSVRSVSLGSAPTSAELISATRRLLPTAEVSLSYGTTEAGPSMFGGHPDGLPLPDGSLGYPLPCVQIRLEGSDPDQGVLHTRTPAVMTGYHGQPERSDQVLDDGWYNTRDIVRRDEDGFYYFLGRADDMFVCAGENIYPGEVEVMLEQHPDIHQAVVVPLPDEDRGQVPVAFVVPRADQRLTAGQVKEFALENAAPHLHPRRVAFRQALPLAGTNKIDRKELAELARRFEHAATDEEGWAR